MVRPTKMRNRQIYRASQALRSKQVSANLSKGLRSKYGRRSIRVVEGDTVMIKRGEYADVPGKVEKIDVASGRISVAGVKKEKAKGDKFDVMMHASNVLVTGLNLSDQRRRDKIGATGEYETDETVDGPGAGTAATTTATTAAADDASTAATTTATTAAADDASTAATTTATTAAADDASTADAGRLQAVTLGDVETGAESPDGAEAAPDETDEDGQAADSQDGDRGRNSDADAGVDTAADDGEDSKGKDNEGSDADDDTGGDHGRNQGDDGGQADKTKQNRPGDEA